jgi:hypothetical protein
MTTETVMGRVRLFTHRAALWLAASLAIIAAPMTFAASGITNITNGLGLTSSSNNLQLTNNSPCVNAGTNLFQVFTNDMRGSNRPSSGAWEIGAYEYP